MVDDRVERHDQTDRHRETQRRRQRTRSIAQAYRDYNELMTICLSLGACVGIGYWLDQKFGLKPLLTVTGVVLGMVTAGFSLRRLVQRFDRRSKERQDSRGSGSSGNQS